MQIPEKLERLITTPKRFKIVIGGRGSGKSVGVADILSMKAQTERAKIGCFREYQNSITDSVHALIVAEIERLRVQGFRNDKTTIDHEDGGKFRFKGLSRSIDAVKSSHGFKYFWVEEAQFLSKQSIKILTPSAREEGSEIWFTGNVISSSDAFSERFIVPYMEDLLKDGYYEDDLHLIIFINHSDNPWFPPVLEQERAYDYKNLDRAMYDHIWEGAFNDSVENSIIKAEWFDACIDSHKKLKFKGKGVRVVSHDPSDKGPDPKGLVERHGSIILEAKINKHGDVNEGCDWALDYAVDHNADVFTWDCDGLGVSLQRQVKEYLEGKNIRFEMFKGSRGAENPDDIYQEPGKTAKDDPRTNSQTFKNLRAQRFWLLRDRVYNTYLAIEGRQYTDPDELISFSSNIKDMSLLRSELCRIPRKKNPNGLIQILGKPEMKKLKINSPNLADSVMMSLTTIPVIQTLGAVKNLINKNRQRRSVR